MSKEQILWLARDKEHDFIGSCAYSVFEKQPIMVRCEAWTARQAGRVLFCMPDVVWEKYFPALTLAPGKKCKVKLSPLEDGIGIRLELI